MSWVVVLDEAGEITSVVGPFQSEGEALGYAEGLPLDSGHHAYVREVRAPAPPA